MRLLTNEELQKDLKGYYERLQITRNKLNNLPVGYLPYQKHKKREKARRILRDEIKHVQILIQIGEEALTDV